MKPYARSERVSGQIQKSLSELLHKKIKDPRLSMATITKVAMSADLRIAKVYYSIPDAQKMLKKAQDGFKSSHGFLKRTLAKKLGLRYMPELKFFYDDSYDYGSKIDKLLKTIHAEHQQTDNGSYRSEIENE